MIKNQNNGNKIACVICRRGCGSLVHKGTRDSSEIDVYQCPVCGTKYLSRIQGNDYENDFMYQTNNMSSLNIEERLVLFQQDDERRYKMIKHLCDGESILDFGCGFGGFLNYISGSTKRYCGVELGRNERDYLNNKGIVCKKSIDEYDQKFDVITLFHTFEHLADPREWLNKFSGHLNRNGKLIIEVPNANDVLLSLYESKSFADFTYWSAHLYLYTVKSLSMLIEETGKYEILSAGQIQRYSIANHLMWLAKGCSGGHQKWNFMDSDELNGAYEKKLAELEMCDTLFFIVRLKE